jgi:hypothetical protein
MKKPRGGPREGAGRKPTHGAPMTRHQVMLDAETLAHLKEIGGGNLSAGIRMAVSALGKSRESTAPSHSVRPAPRMPGR